MREELVGTISHYYSNLHVAAVLLKDDLSVGDRIHVKGHKSDFTQTIDSMQLEHSSVSFAHVGQSVGIKVADHAREHDEVYRLVE